MERKKLKEYQAAEVFFKENNISIKEMKNMEISEEEYLHLYEELRKVAPNVALSLNYSPRKLEEREYMQLTTEQNYNKIIENSEVKTRYLYKVNDFHLFEREFSLKDGTLGKDYIVSKDSSSNFPSYLDFNKSAWRFSEVVGAQKFATQAFQTSKVYFNEVGVFSADSFKSRRYLYKVGKNDPIVKRIRSTKEKEKINIILNKKNYIQATRDLRYGEELLFEEVKKL